MTGRTSSADSRTNGQTLPLVSVVMNCYNGEKYIREAIDSVIAQTFADWEIIFWDNQSTDSTAERVKEYSDSRIRYFVARSHTLLGEARNLAVAEAKGTWIAFLDSDDKWYPFRLADHVAVAEADASGTLGLIYGRAELLVEGGAQRRPVLARRALESHALVPDPRRIKRLPEGDILPSLARHNFIPLVAATVSRAAFFGAGGFCPLYNQAEDYDLFVKIARIATARSVQRNSSIYRVHSANLSSRQRDLSDAETIDVLEKLPASSARTAGLRIAYTTRAMHLLEKGQWREGLLLLLSRGSTVDLFSRLFRHLIMLASS